MNNDNIRNRKIEHLDIVREKPVGFDGVSAGFDSYQFVHQALPEINLSDIDLSTTLFKRKLNAPIFISSMVGGIEASVRINHNLAKAAQALGVGMGVGSQRCAIECPDNASSFKVRHIAPDILLFANLGAVQLNNGYTVDECRRAIEMIEADALILHLNPLQEALQPSGNTNFANLLKKIGQVCRGLTVPVIVKEVGFGISEDVARKLAEIGVSGIDVAGAGGTSWSEVERHRAQTDIDNRIAAAFASWGIPTTESICMARRGAPATTIIASGGIRTGIDVAKVIALGARAVGVGLPLLKAADTSSEAVIEVLKEIISVLKIAMFCIGAANLSALRDTPYLVRKGA